MSGTIAMQELSDALQQEDSSSSSDEEMVVYGPRTSRSSDDNTSMGSSTYRGKSGRYSNALKTFRPIRPFSGEGLTRVDQAGCLSFITYSWVFGYLWSAFRGLIPRDQTWSCSDYDASNVNMARLEFLWKEELKKPGRASLVRVVIKFFQTRLIMACLIFLFCLAFGFIGPTCLVRALVAYSEGGEENKQLRYGLFLSVALLAVELCRVLAYGATWAISYRSGVRVRGALLGLLYKKLIYARSLKDKTAAEIVNIYANDGQRVFDAITFAPLVIMGPLVLVGGIIYLLALIGPWSLVGVAVFFIFDVIQYGLGKTMVKYRKQAISNTEQRVSMMGEILRCIRVIKMNAWEHPFMEKIYEYRHAEKYFLRQAGLAQSLAIAAGPVVPVVAAILTFLGYTLSGNDLIASQAFSAITVFFVMVFGVRMIPYGMRYCAEASVALRNMQKLFEQSEFDAFRPPPLSKALALVLQDASFGWDHQNVSNNSAEKTPLALEAKSKESALTKINLIVEKKQLVGICGPVGCGKTALLHAIIGQMIQQDGNILMDGSLAFAAQQPWIQNATLRDNILFGEEFDEQKYYRVLYACSLNQDINSMPAADQTEIGERGVTLSGGQRARLSLARALYAPRDVYLLDDVLSALDQPVAHHVFAYALKGLLVGNTVLLVCSNPQLLSQCDEVVYMESGRVIDQGPFADLSARCSQFADFCLTTESKLSQQAPPLERLLGDGTADAETLKSPTRPTMSGSELSLVRHKREMGERADTNLSAADSIADLPAAVSGETTWAEEDFGLAAVALRVYGRYMKAAGGTCALVILFAAFIANVAATIFATTWLSYWIKEAQTPIVTFNESLNTTNAPFLWSMHEMPNFSSFAIIYAISLVLLLVTGAFKAVIFVRVTLNAASRLHNQMFDKVLHATMRFFDATPSGRILNRFSKDIDEIDVKLPFCAESFLQNLFTVIAYLVVIAWVFPHFLIACVPLAMVFALFVACFRAGIRSLKRSENLSRSPLFEHIGSSLDGLVTIHAFGQTKRFLEQLRLLLDQNSGSLFMYQSAMRWLAVWLDLLVVAVTFTTALLVAITVGHVSPAYAGMALAFAIQMSGIFQFAVRMQTELEAKMTSVERVDFYIQEIEEEGEWQNTDFTPPIDWPDKGRISFRDVKLRYRETFPLALRGVSFDIQPKEKIGIVGRTGSGKSSLASALFRLYPLSAGEVAVDGVDVGRVGLHSLRRAVEAIPQQPTLFAGTVRFNLDPARIHTDDQLWQALERTEIKDLVSSLGGLDGRVEEGGRNVSAGERQLVCLARALLRHVKVLVLDEATAWLDAAGDARVRRCLDALFADCTQLVVAHRLASVLHAHKILHLDNGRVVEFDEPRVLLNDPKSRFYQLASDADRSAERVTIPANTG